MKDSSPASLFFKTPPLTGEKNQDNQASLHQSPNAVELEKILNKSAFKEAKKQWKTLIADLDQV